MRAFDDEARYTAYECLYEVLENQGYSNLVLSSKLRKTPLSSSEKSFAPALFYGTVTRVYLCFYLFVFLGREVGFNIH